MTTSSTDRPAVPLKPAALGGALTVGANLLIGQYRVDLPTGIWWWSDEIYTMHGWAPGSVEPGMEAMRSRKHPDDRGRLLRTVVDAVRSGKPFSSGHRIVDGHGRARMVVVTGQARRGRNGKVTQIAGYVVDVTPLRQEILDREANRAVTRAFVSAASIEQAKGVLMAVRGLNEIAATRALSERAGRSGVTVQEAATQMMAEIGRLGGLTGDTAAVVDQALEAIHEVVRPRSHNAQLARRREPASL